MEKIDTLRIKVGNYGFNWAFTVKESTEAVVDLTDYTVKINIWHPDNPSTPLVDGGTVVQDTPASGTCHWVVTNVFAREGTYIGELELTKSGVVEDSRTFTIQVEESPTSS